MAKLLPFLFCLLAASTLAQHPEWNYFYSGESASTLSARGNTILVCPAGGLGITRFDTLGNATAYHIYNSDIPFLSAGKVCVDPAGHWWVQHPDGVARYDGTTWTNWDATQVGLDFVGTTFTAMQAAENGTIWLATSNKGVCFFENNSWTVWNTGNSGLPSGNIRDIAFGADGQKYFATNAGLARLDDTTWTVYNAANTGFSNFNNCKSVAVTPAGGVWVTEGVNRFAKWEAGVWTELTAADIGLSAAGVSGQVEADAQGRLWLSFSKSISRLEGGNWTHYTETDFGCTVALSALSSIQMQVDAAGQLWSTVCGLSRFDGQQWQAYLCGNSSLPKGQVNAITEDSAGRLWFGSAKGVAMLDGDQWQAFDAGDWGGTESWVLTAHGDALGNVWFGADNGEILRFDGSAWTVFDTVAKAFPGFAVYWSMASAPDGTVWFSLVPAGPYSALARYKNGDWTFFTPDNAPLANNQDIVSIAVQPDGAAWFLSNDRLLRYDGGQWSTFDPKDSGLSYGILRHMALAPDASLWIASDAGLLRFDGSSWSSLTAAGGGIPSDDTYRISFDRASGMYLGYKPSGTAANCAVLRGGAWTELLPAGFEPGFSTRPWVILTDRDNQFWFTNFNDPVNGVFRYDPMLLRAWERPAAEERWQVFPNPARSVLQVTVQGDTPPNNRFDILDLHGKTLRQTHSGALGRAGARVDPGDLPSGMYLLRWVAGDKVLGLKRFVLVRE